MKITQFSVHRKLATLAILVALVVLGVQGFLRLPVDFLPNVTYPMIKVHIWWRGATPEEVEKNIAEPLERQMSTVDDIDFIESSSIEGMYTLQANFRYDVDVNTAYQDALAALSRVSRDLPKDIDPPVMIKADPSQLPVVQLTVSSETWDLVQLRTWSDIWLQDQLLAVPGVAGTEIVGGLKREIRVHLDTDALEKYGLTLEDILRRLREENIEQFGGRVTIGRREIIARTMGEFQTLDEIRAVVVLKADGAVLRLGDVAEVSDAHEETRVITRLDGNPCVKLSVLKQASANTVEVARAVDRRILELNPLLPEGIQIGMVENQADYVGSALAGVRNAAMEAAVLVLLVVYLFLGSLRQTLIIAVALPLTLLLNFGLMQLAGFSLNIFSLGGLVVAIGVLVDNSVIVVETITRRYHEAPDAEVAHLVISSSTEIGPAVVAATLAFLALFLPFLLVPGLMSLLFRELILVIAGIVIVSLLMAVTITPLLSAVILGGANARPKLTRFEQWFERMASRYAESVAFVLRHKWAVLGVFALALAAALPLAGRLGSVFLPQMDDGRVMVKVKMPTGRALGETDRVLAEIEQRLADDSRIASLFTLSGGKVWGLYTYEIANEGELNIQLVPKSDRNISTEEYIEEIRPIVMSVPTDGKVMVMQMKIKGIRSLGDSDVEVKVKGEDTAELHRLASELVGRMNGLGCFTNVHISLDMTKPEYQVMIDRTRAAELGVSIEAISETLKTLISGTVATRLRDGNEYYNIRVMVPENRIVRRADVENLLLSSRNGGTMRLRDVASVVESAGPVEIIREDQIKQVVVRGDAAGLSVGEAMGRLETDLAGWEIPAGYQHSLGGQAQMINDMRRGVIAILAFAVFFAFIVLAVQFNSLRLPAMILGSVPFCMAGLVALLGFTGVPFGATVLIGALVVVAATVNDGVLLMTFADSLQEQGLATGEAVVEAARIRLRPRVMTTLCVLIGFLPLALALEEGGDMLQPLAVAAIGGLLMEVLVALYLMPCFYVIAGPRFPKLKGSA